MLLNPNAFSSTEFSYDAKSRTFSVEMSTLDQGGKRPVFGRVYDDAIDEGLSIISNMTGIRLVFVVDKIDYQGTGDDREVAGWWLVPAPEGIRNKSYLKDLRLLIIND